MRNMLVIAGMCTIVSACTNNKPQTEDDVKGPGKVTYPVTATADSSSDFFGTTVADPYRWLEAEANDDPKVRQWVTDQNKVTFDYLAEIPYREQIKQRMLDLANYPKMTTPSRAGDYYYYQKNDGLQNQNVTYYRKGINGEEKVFLDPNKASADGTLTQSMAGFNQKRTYVAINEAKAGSDWNTMYVKDVVNNTMMADKIEWTKFSSAAWQGDGFYYSAYDKPSKTYTGSSENQKVYYHKIGDPQSKDKLIYTDPKHPLYYFSAQTTDDERYLFIYVSPGTSGTEILWKDLRTNAKSFTKLFEGFDYEYTILDNDGDDLLVMTNYQAPNYRVVRVDPTKPAPENWTEVIAEQKELLSGVSLAGGYLFASYLRDVKPVIIQFDRYGKPVRQIGLPNNGVGGTVAGFNGEKDDKTVYFSFTTFLTPADIYSYDIESGKIELYKKAEVKFNSSDYTIKQVFYTSQDGTKVPMFIVHKKGIKLDGSHPTLLYGYGGFNIPIQPSFSISRVALLEQGFIYAVANIRGGSEYGEEWHKAAMFEKKQNVFDDFIAAAEYLIDQKYTSNTKLAIQGRSNGGLLVGACMTQRPDLYAVALPGVGVMDMLRYHRFTVGWGWAVEYGCADSSKEAFDYLSKYSPLHNIKPGTKYPATMVTTADHDDRVVPAHSFKFAAALQAAQTGDAPTLIRIDTQAGHGAGKPLAKQIEEDADWISFTMWNTGIKHMTITDKP
ncbi:MAG TPA: prolyl oligopeptidase family serine peptidase [Chitinophagales bacterium]|nr:prolyl oligopeptidase family serine peptidase [Chitinophagales bacterium]HNE46105.1 prolyl oligopeptidase family serine peptidase [Chitinophagales bacterium]